MTTQMLPNRQTIQITKETIEDRAIVTLGNREQFRDHYWLKKDPIYQDRLLWRAQTFRHLVHLLPNQSILEIGAGQGIFTEQLCKISKGENPITAVSFVPDNLLQNELPSSVEFLRLSSLPGELKGRRFDFVIAMDLLDSGNCSWFLQNIYSFLKPGGQVLFYESNPWNIVLKIRRLLKSTFGKTDDPRRLLNRTALYELISEVGFVNIFAIYNDFVYAPLTRSMVWFFRNLSILLENMPVIQNFAGSILIHAKKPHGSTSHPKLNLFAHEKLRGAISVVIPCHNEEMNIKPLVLRLLDFYREYIHEIILVDDNSQDGTAREIQKLVEEYPFIKPIFRSHPNGVGRAISDGYRKATGQYILSMDCDFIHLLPELRDLFAAAAEGSDVVVGSRFSRHSVLLNYPFQKIAANRAFHVLAQLLFFRKFRDLTNNLKLMRREVIKQLHLTQPGFAVNAETGLQPLLMRFSVKEVPISWINRTADMGGSSFRLLKFGGGYFKVLLNLWLRTFFGAKKLSFEVDYPKHPIRSEVGEF